MFINNFKYSVMSVLGIILTGFFLTATAEPKVQFLSGQTGSSSQWGSGWIDLDIPTNFKEGDKLKLIVGGTASKIKVRLLPKGGHPDSTTGILSGKISVTDDRVVEVLIRSVRTNITQISVHGGQNPWGRFPLGGGNGPATLDSAELIRP